MIKTLSYAFAAMRLVTLLLAAGSVPATKVLAKSSASGAHGLWSIYEKSLKSDKILQWDKKQGVRMRK